MIFNRFSKKEFPGATMEIAMPIHHNAMRGRRLFEEGYQYNVVVYRVVNQIIKAIQNINIDLIQNGQIIDNHIAIDLLKNPNPAQGFDSFIAEAFINKLILGEMFIATAEDGNKVPTELWNFDPLEIEIIPGKNVAREYKHKVNGRSVTFPVDTITGDSQMFFWREINPLDKWRGMSPLFPASLPADMHNSGLKWNFSLLKKGARPSGLVTFKGEPSEQTIARMREYFKEQWQGENNAGELPILTGEGSFQELGKTPKDMDFNTSLDKGTAFIAMAYGVPLPLVLNDASTFNNYKEAKESLYIDTVLPIFTEFLSSFSTWLLPKFGMKNAFFAPDLNSIQALESVRERKRNSISDLVAKGIISPDEARVDLGYDEVGGASAMQFMPASNMPISDNGMDMMEDEKSLLLRAGFTEEEIKEIEVF